MLKKYIVLFLINLLNLSSLFCSDTTKQTLTLATNYNNYNPINEFENYFTCQFPSQLQFLLSGPLGDGQYKGGAFVTHLKNDDKKIVVHILPSCWKEIKAILDTTNVDLSNGDTTNTYLNTRSKSACFSSIFNARPKTIDSSNFDTSRVEQREAATLRCLLDIFQETTLLETKKTNDCTLFSDSEKEKNNLRLIHNTLRVDGAEKKITSAYRYAASTLTCYIPSNKNGSNTMGYERINDFRNSDLNNIHRHVLRGSYVYERHAPIYLTQGLWYQLAMGVISQDKTYANHPLYRGFTPNPTPQPENFLEKKKNKKMQIAQKVAAATLGAAALTTAAYGYLWYTGRGQQLPGMNTVFTPTFTYIATKAFNPLCAKVATVFGKKVIDTGADLAKTTLHTMATAAELIK